MKRFKKITIIGVGLIGGSIGLAIKKRGLAKEVAGVFHRRSTLQKALKCKAVDKGFMNIKDGVRGADLIILAAPVSSIASIGREAMKYAMAGAIITDVGSTKSLIVRRMEKALRADSADFVGSHPMAGSEHAGVEFARGDLMDGSPCIVTKTLKTKKAVIAKVANFWRSLGAKVTVMTPSRHDRSVALISHLPHIVAFGLAAAVPERELAYAAEGFKDTTRVASSDPYLWADIFSTNRIEAIKACRMFEKSYKDIIKALAKNDYQGIVRALKKGKAKRDKFVYGSTK